MVADGQPEEMNILLTIPVLGIGQIRCQAKGVGKRRRRQGQPNTC